MDALKSILGIFFIIAGLGESGTNLIGGLISIFIGIWIFSKVKFKGNTNKETNQFFNNTNVERQKVLKEIELLTEKLSDKQFLYNEVINSARNSIKEESESIVQNAKDKASKLTSDTLYSLKNIYEESEKERLKLSELEKKCFSFDKKILSQEKQLSRIRNIYDSVEHSIDKYFNMDSNMYNLKLDEKLLSEMSILAPSVILKLHCMDIKDLRKSYKENENLITELLSKYESRYTTKQNKSIYSLMVIALRAESQNILYNLKFDRLDKALESLAVTTEKLKMICVDGNQIIASNILKFIGEAELLFENAIKIEYEYSVRKEKEKEEQATLREQMKQESEERKILEQQQKQIEKEEEKYKSEITNIMDIIASTQDENKLHHLEARILELQKQLSSVDEKKEEIISRQNGKAGYVYVISNLGSFGENVFKIGMTRRLDPMDRINELSSASVPFPFGVHSFIFSEDAVELEQKLHNILDKSRVNKVNLRKEFFKISINELENLVTEIDPAAEFNKTMIALQYEQTLSIEMKS